MRKLLLLSLVCIVVGVPAAFGDTLHLKNGSVLKGKVTSFADEQFTVMLDTGSNRYLSKATVYIGDVASIEFDSANSTPTETSAANQPADKPVRPTAYDNPPEPKSQKSAAASDQAKKGPPSDQPRESAPPESQTVTAPTREADAPVSDKTDKPSVSNPPSTTPPSQTTGSAPGSDSAEGERLNRKPAGPVKTVTVDVVGKRDWTSTGLIVRRGDRIRITASGNVTLDSTGGRTSGPEGLPDLPDAKKLMADQPTGALIGVIGADNDEFIFIGRSAEFSAARDGLLFLSVNEGNLSDNSGTYKAVIEVQGQRAK